MLWLLLQNQGFLTIFTWATFSCSVARRPIYPGRRSRFKCTTSSYQREQIMASDEGNTSEYSNPPSSKSSTLESNPDRLRVLPNLSGKRATIDRSDGSSDSESEENITIATQVCYDMKKGENLVWMERVLAITKHWYYCCSSSLDARIHKILYKTVWLNNSGFSYKKSHLVWSFFVVDVSVCVCVCLLLVFFEYVDFFTLLTDIERYFLYLYLCLCIFIFILKHCCLRPCIMLDTKEKWAGLMRMQVAQ